MSKEFTKTVLDNGVTLYLYSDKNLKRTFVSYSVNFGSNGLYNNFYFKGKKQTIPFGLAHFLEHTLIEHSKYGNMMHYFMDLGYETNGATYDELTTFYFLGIEQIESSIEKLISMVDAPVFTKESIEEVKPAVVEELKSKFDNKFSVAFANNARNCFKSFEQSHLANNSLGTKEETEKFTYDLVKMVYDAYYYDENKILVIAGNINKKKIIEMVNNIYKRLPKHKKYIEQIKYTDLEPVRKKKEIIPWGFKGPDAVVLAFKNKINVDIPILKLDYYMYIYNFLKFNSGTKFSENLIKEKLVIGGVEQSTEFIDLDGEKYMIIRYIFESPKYTKVLERIKSQLNCNNLDKEKFELRKKSLIVGNIQKRDYMYNIFNGFAYHLEFTDKIDEVDVIKSLDFEEMKRVINSLDFSNTSISVVKYKNDDNQKTS